MDKVHKVATDTSSEGVEVTEAQALSGLNMRFVHDGALVFMTASWLVQK